MIKGILFDLDGTVYLGEREIPGASAFISRLAKIGIKYLFVTNRANRTPRIIAKQLNSYGINCTAENILTSAEATAQYLKSGSVFFIGEEGMRDALSNAGLRITDQSPDYVIVSFEKNPGERKLDKAAELIRNGAKFIGTNPDRNLPLDDSVVPGTGALIDAVAGKCGIKPLIIGKPGRIIIDMAVQRLGFDRSEIVTVGDNVETDIPAGVAAGVRTIFILTGISKRGDLERIKERPSWIAEDYRDLERIISENMQ